MDQSTHTLPATQCFLNGEFTRLDQAKVSVMDRGFIFGDGVYEVIPVYAGQAFRVQQHMVRLDRSLAELRIANPYTPERWLAIALQLLATDSKPEGDFLVYLQVTRGVAVRDHVMPKDLTPTVFMTYSTMKPASAEQRASGVACVSAEDFRWKKAHIKSISLLGSVFARQISADVGAVETVMFRDGFLSEASASNVWVVKDGAVAGPPRDNLVLEGIRYGLIAELCAKDGIPFALRPITRAEVLACDELLISSATKEVLPVTQLDGQPVGNNATLGKPGPVYRKLYAAYQEAKQQARASAGV